MSKAPLLANSPDGGYATPPGMRLVAVLLVFLAAGCFRPADGRPLVVVAVVDGLSPQAVSSGSMPALSALAVSPGATFWSRARAVMPSVTNTNHVSMVTGVHAAAHGITGNYFWDRSKPPAAAPMDRSELLEAATLFTLAAGAEPRLSMAAAFGKPKLARLFGEGARQRAPDHLWTAAFARGRQPRDETTMTEALRLLDRFAPDFLFVALADVDLTSHGRGPESDEARHAVATADRQIARLVARLRETGRWRRTILFVTADHSFASVGPGGESPRPVISLGRALERAGLAEGLVVVSDGTLAHVYRRDGDPGSADLRRAARVLGAVPGVARVLAPEDAGVEDVPVVEAEHPDWRIGHPRSGDLLVVASPGHHFDDPSHAWAASLLGQHGGPDERPVPMLAAGGHPLFAVAQQVVGEDAGQHRLAHRHGADADAGVVAALGQTSTSRRSLVDGPRGVRIDEVGFTAKRATTGWPVEMPPRMPPAWFDRNSGLPSLPMRISSAFSSPVSAAAPKPSPISTPLTALIDISAAAMSWSSLP
jgi:phosphonoacetate hydrolase